MQSTTNYSMNLVEGTDLVNIPVQLNPNFQTIDQEMFANKQSSIGTASEVVTGSVHAVIRNNTDSNVFRFTATGAWTSGDTMTLDGSAVTVHLADGTAPGNGAYVIGAEVVAVVNGSLVTLLTSAAQPVAGVTSFNNRTGAVSPAASDYDASMIDYDNTGSGLNATDVQGAIDELAGGAGYRVLETAPANTTYASQLATLNAKYITLTAAEKMHCKILINDENICDLSDVTYGYFTFLNVLAAHVICFRYMLTGRVFKSDTEPTGTTFTEITSDTNTETMKLIYV